MSNRVEGYRTGLLWNLGFNAYWFATSYKWFILLLFAIPQQVAAIVPPDQKNQSWGLVYAIGAVWAIVGPTIFGSWSDRVSGRWGHRQPFIAAGAGLTVIGVSVLGGMQTLAGLTLAYLLLQVADDVGTGPYAGMLPEMVPTEHRGRAASVMTLMQRLAELCSAGVAVAVGRLDLIFVGIAVVTVLGALWTLATVRHVRPLPEAAGAPDRQWWQSWLTPWKSPDFRWVWFSRLLASMALFLITNYLLYYLKDTFDSFRVGPVDLREEGRAAQVLAIAVSLFGAVGAILGARLVDKAGSRRVVIGSGFLIATVLVPFALAREFLWLILLAVPFGIGSGLRASADTALATMTLTDLREAGAQMGLWSSSQTAVQVLVGAAGAGIGALNAAREGSGYQVAIWLSGALFLLSTLAVVRVRAAR